MREKVSGYLQIYNDYELLEATLNSVKGFVDELIVVDGCYEWMAGYYKSIGCDPEESNEEVYAVIRRCGIPFKVIKGVWSNQIEKRIAGYSACSYRYKARLDADEILFFNEAVLNSFFCSEYAVAAMSMPTFITPYHYTIFENDTCPAQAFLFDSAKISAEDHLSYLWLVLTKEVLPVNALNYEVYSDPIAFNAHLTSWRSLSTSVGRAAYYVTNWMRKNGYPWIAAIGVEPITSFENFFSYITPQQFNTMLKFSETALGKVVLEFGEKVIKIDHTELSNLISPLYEKYIESNALIFAETVSTPFFSGADLFIDVLQYNLIAPNSIFCCEVDVKINHVECEIIELLNDRPQNKRISIDVQIYKSNCFKVIIPPIASSEILRRLLRIQIHTEGVSNLQFLNYSLAQNL